MFNFVYLCLYWYIHMCFAYKGQKKASDLLDMESKVDVRRHVNTGNHLGFLSNEKSLQFFCILLDDLCSYIPDFRYDHNW